jgi:hypothetical protein
MLTAPKREFGGRLAADGETDRGVWREIAASWLVKQAESNRQRYALRLGKSPYEGGESLAFTVLLRVVGQERSGLSLRANTLNRWRLIANFEK